MTAHGRLAQPSSMEAPGNLPEQPAKSGWRLETGGWRPGTGETKSHNRHHSLYSFGFSSSSPSSFTPSSSSLQPPASSLPRRAGFTLVELLITVSVIAIMASMVLFALFAAQETARVQKTKSLIAKLDAIIKAKYEAYKTRRVPVNTAGMPPQAAATARLNALHDLMRMEMPDRWSDIADDPTLFSFGRIPRPAVYKGYKRKYDAIVTRTSPPPPPPSDVAANAGAECLYMIIAAAQNEEGDDKTALKQDQIGDVDGDGFPEIIDAWGQPIKFLRWAPGFVSDLQVVASPTVTNTAGSNVTSQSNQLSSVPGSYVGGALMADDPANPGRFQATSLTKITGYNYTAGTPGTGSFDFIGGTFSVVNSQRFYVLAPDPFDPRGVQPLSFALYPLIYSGGPDKCFGICPDFGGGAGFLRYSTINDNPFYVGTDGVDGQQRLIGTPRDEPGEINFVTRGWVDNIHNHQITAR